MLLFVVGRRGLEESIVVEDFVQVRDAVHIHFGVLLRPRVARQARLSVLLLRKECRLVVGAGELDLRLVLLRLVLRTEVRWRGRHVDRSGVSLLAEQ